VLLEGGAVAQRVNIEGTDDLWKLEGVAHDGVGLFRTEYLFLNAMRPPSEEEQYAPYRAVAEKAAAFRAKLSADVDRDSDSYAQVLKAFQMPKATEAEKADRSRAVQEAFKQAARVPLGVARDAVAIMDLGRAVISKGNPNAASDGAAGVLAARMAARTAVFNVRINLSAIKDEALTSELRQEADRLEVEAEAKERAALAQLKI
jgi:formiminotetrahydrofolate cyclodeaminase